MNLLIQRRNHSNSIVSYILFILYIFYIRTSLSFNIIETSFIISHRIALISPISKDSIIDNATFSFEVSFGRWPVTIEESHFLVPINLDGNEVFLEIPSSIQFESSITIVNDFCQIHHLSQDNCDWLIDRVEDLYKQNVGVDSDELIMSQLKICLTLKHSNEKFEEKKLCHFASSQVSFHFNSLDRGTYHLFLTGHHIEGKVEKKLINNENRHSGFDELLPGFGEIEMPQTITVKSPHCSNLVPSIKQPLHGSLLGPLVELDIDMSLNTSQLCLSLDSDLLGCHDWPPLNKPYLRSLSPGRHKLEVWFPHHHPLPSCKVISEFEVTFEESITSRTSAFNIMSKSSSLQQIYSTSSDMSNLVFVTGASQRYYNENILQNLIGSIHHWEPFAQIEVFDFGLDFITQGEISKWENVKLNHLPLDEMEDPLPPHFFIHGFGAYAAKPWVTLNVLERAMSREEQVMSNECKLNGGDDVTCNDSRLKSSGSSVFWIDANTELRRPLSGSSLLSKLHLKGGFFVTHPYNFPSPQFHHPSTVESLGCHVTEGSLPHCATTFMGFTTTSLIGLTVIEKVLKPLVACGLNISCVFPLGSSRSNHRQEQTALNAILCNLSHGHLNSSNKDNISSFSLCSSEDKYKLTSDFENRNHKLQPTSDPTDWNEMMFYTRRRHPTKPYIPFLKIQN